MGGIDMKIKNLMIGDWVMANNVPCKIWPINEHGVFSEKGTSYYSMEEIKAIPITTEILEKNGFSPETFLTTEWEKEVYFKEFSSCVVEPDDSGKYIFGTTIYWNKTDGDGSPIDWGTIYNSMIYNLQYVHELQHALRLCGLDELADNFEV